MPVSNPQTGSSSDIELPVLASHARSFQLHGRASSSSLIPEKENHKANPTDGVVVIVEPPAPAYFPPANDIPPTPLSCPRQPGDDDRTSVQTSEVHPEALPAYRTDSPPVYSHRPTRYEPTTWSMLCFRFGFRMFFYQIKWNSRVNFLASLVLPLFWLCGTLTLITPRNPFSRICMPWFQDFVPYTESWCDDNLQTEAERETHLARVRAVEIKWAKKCLLAFSLLLCFVIAIAITTVAVSKAQWVSDRNLNYDQKRILIVMVDFFIFLLFPHQILFRTSVLFPARWFEVYILLGYLFK